MLKFIVVHSTNSGKALAFPLDAGKTGQSVVLAERSPQLDLTIVHNCGLGCEEHCASSVLRTVYDPECQSYKLLR